MSHICQSKANVYLEKKIKGSQIVWGIESEFYASKGSYSLLEFELANNENKYQAVKIE